MPSTHRSDSLAEDSGYMTPRSGMAWTTSGISIATGATGAVSAANQARLANRIAQEAIEQTLVASKALAIELAKEAVAVEREAARWEHAADLATKASRRAALEAVEAQRAARKMSYYVNHPAAELALFASLDAREDAVQTTIRAVTMRIEAATTSSAARRAALEVEVLEPNARRLYSAAPGLFRNGDRVRVQGSTVVHVRTNRSVPLEAGAVRGVHTVEIRDITETSGEFIDLRHHSVEYPVNAGFRNVCLHQYTSRGAGRDRSDLASRQASYGAHVPWAVEKLINFEERPALPERMPRPARGAALPRANVLEQWSRKRAFTYDAAASLLQGVVRGRRERRSLGAQRQQEKADALRARAAACYSSVQSARAAAQQAAAQEAAEREALACKPTSRSNNWKWPTQQGNPTQQRQAQPSSHSNVGVAVGRSSEYFASQRANYKLTVFPSPTLSEFGSLHRARLPYSAY